jgi:hypothetical protein
MEIFSCFGIVIDEHDALEWLLQGQVLAVSDQSAVLDGALHACEPLLDFLVEQCFVVFRNLQEVD